MNSYVKPIPIAKRGLLSNIDLSVPTKVFRALSFNSPLVSSIILASALGLTGWYGAPYVKDKLNQFFPIESKRKRDKYGRLEDPDKDLRTAAAVTLGSIGALLPIAGTFSTDAPGYGLLQYGPMYKSSSAFPSIPLADATQIIHDNPELTPAMKLNAIGLLSSFNAPPHTPITGGDIVGQAIATGQSAAAGAAIGYITAQALGLDNPKSAAIFGAVANTLGMAPAIASRYMF